MKPLIRILSLWLAALCFGACTDDDLIDGTPTPEPETGIVIRLSAGDLEQTRTALTSQADMHNVQEVYALLYQGHGDDATFYACDKLDWNPKDSTDKTGVQAQKEEFLLPNSGNLVKGDYTVLCVGLDDQSGKTYNLPDAIKDKKLSEAKATLAEGKTKDDIAKSELFAGWNQFHFAPDSLNIVEVEMKRRVAGVLCYLTDVPYELTISGEKTGTYRVTKVQVCLYKNQNSEISLLRKEIEGKVYPADFGSKELDDSNVLMEFPLEGYPKQQDKNLYAIPQQKGLAPNSLLKGVYMIPIDSEEGANTIEVKVLGKEIDSATDNPASDAEEVVIATFPAINDDIDFEATEGSTKSYPIRPNMIYHIGSKPSDDEVGTPESLAGTEVKIGVKCWENETVDVEFPSVPITLKMQLVNSELAPYTMQDPDDLSKPYYIFDCIGSTDNFLKVERSVLYNYWKVIVQAVPGGNFSGQDKMIYFGQKYNSTTPYPYKDTFYGSGIDYIPIAMTDYAKRDSKTSRKIQIRLIAMNGSGENAAEVPGTEVTMTVEQYNAIIVDMGDSEYRGFSHFNFNTERYIDGTIKEDKGVNQHIQWGYWSSLRTWIFGEGVNNSSDTNGKTNYQYASDPKSWAYSVGFKDSAIDKCAEKGCSISSDSTTLMRNEATWYLPAQEELNRFFTQYYSDVNAHIAYDEYYWSSNAQSGVSYEAFAYKVNSTGNINSENKDRDEYFLARQCCNVQ